MATSQEVQVRVSYARTLLESGFKTATICTMIQARFPVSRSTGYNDIHAAQAELEACDDGPSTDESDCHVDPDEMAAQARYMFNIAIAQGDAKQASQAVKMMDTIMKWNGRAATLQGSTNKVTSSDNPYV